MQGEAATVAVAVDLPFRQAAGLIEGISAWARVNRPGWRLLPMQPGFETRLVELASSGRLDAVIGTFVSDAWIDSLREQGVYAVNMFHVSRIRSVSVIGVDERGTGMEAAKHLLEQGAQALAFLGGGGFLATQLKREGFEAGASQCQVYHLSGGTSMEESLAEASSAGIPLGVFCASDTLALDLVAAGRHLKLKLGENLLVVGFGDDPAASIFAGCQLTSFALPMRALGEQAALLLSRQLELGCNLQPNLNQGEFLLPAELIVRESSLASRARSLAQRASQIVLSRHAESDFDVSMLARACGVSRRLLETTLHKELGISPAHLIASCRLDSAMRLLTTTSLPIHEIASRIGFLSQHHFSNWFRKKTGQSPRDARIKKNFSTSYPK